MQEEYRSTLAWPVTGRRHARRGGAYVLVLGSCMLVTILGLTAIAASRGLARIGTADNDQVHAQAHAQSAIGLGRFWIAQDPMWRTTRTAGSWTPFPQPVGRGSFTLEVTNPNAVTLGNSIMDPVVLTGTGFSGTARHRTQLTLVPVIRAHTCLNVAMASGGNQSYSGTANAVDCNQTVASNRGITASGTAFNATALEAVTSLSLSSCTGTGGRSFVTSPRTLPDPATAFDSYLAEGTPISMTSLLTASGGYAIDRKLISPANNPFGLTNPNGVYVIDCLGLPLTIQDSRVVGTLVLLNPGAGTAVQGSVVWSPAVANYPSLLVRGDAAVRFGTTALVEDASGKTPDVNFNPAGTPYPHTGNNADADVLDSYASQFDGLVYVSGNLTLSGSPTIKGVIVCEGTISSTSAPLKLTFLNTFAKNPPPGFFPPPEMQAKAGSWAQAAN